MLSYHSAAVFASQDPGSKVVGMIPTRYINKTEILQYIYSWSSSGPTQQQVTFAKHSWGSTMCNEECGLTFELTQKIQS